jgi:hypothetical protein
LSIIKYNQILLLDRLLVAVYASYPACKRAGSQIWSNQHTIAEHQRLVFGNAHRLVEQEGGVEVVAGVADRVEKRLRLAAVDMAPQRQLVRGSAISID